MLVWGFCAQPDLILPQKLRKPISKAIRQPDIRQSDIRQSDIRQSDIRQSDIRQSDNRPYTKKQRKPITPKQGKEQPGPPSHGETAMARAIRMSRCRSTRPRNAKFSNRGSEPLTSIELQLGTTNMILNTCQQLAMEPRIPGHFSKETPPQLSSRAR